MNRKEESEIFNRMADYYDTYRPGYPAEIVDAILRRAGLSAGARLLEIGSGSGKATAQFADYGFEMLCVDPGEDLVRKGNQAFRDRNIRFVVSRFEDYPLPHAYYDAIISAQAFHWLPQPLGYEKCAHTLKPGGFLAPFWNLDIVRRDADLDQALQAIVDKYGAVSCMPEQNYAGRMESIAAGMAGSGLFSRPEILHAHWERTYTADEYYDYMTTGNVFIQNAEKEKQLCHDELTQLASEHGGIIARRYVCELYLAQRL